MIKNKAEDRGQHTEDLRNEFEHRAAWMYLMYKEAKKQGLSDAFAHEAIRACGRFHGETKYTHTDDFNIFHREFINDNVKGVFQMEDNCKEGTLSVDFHYCPLVAAWKKLGASDEECEVLCDIAMDGDRGICETLNFDFYLGKTIAKGDDICEVRISKR